MTQVGDIWFRLEDQGYSIPDEWGEHAYTRYEVRTHKYVVEKVTPCGVRLREQFGLFKGTTTRFVLTAANKQFACPTMDDAKVSFIARKTKQAGIYENRAKIARMMIERAKQL